MKTVLYNLIPFDNLLTFSSYHSSEQLTFFQWCSCVYCTASCFTGYGKQVQLAEHLQKASATKSVSLRYEISSTKNHFLVCLDSNSHSEFRCVLYCPIFSLSWPLYFYSPFVGFQYM